MSEPILKVDPSGAATTSPLHSGFSAQTASLGDSGPLLELIPGIEAPEEPSGASREHDFLRDQWIRAAQSVFVTVSFRSGATRIPELLGRLRDHEGRVPQQSPDLLKIEALIVRNEFEAGATHPAQDYLATFFSVTDPETQGRNLDELWNSLETTDDRVTLIRCLGRISHGLAEGSSAKLIGYALGSNEAILRDAGIRALEAWGTSNSRDTLVRHQAAETNRRLAEFLERVIADLSKE